MPHYQVVINGQNFLITLEDRLTKYGFFALRYVEAADAAAAEKSAIESVRELAKLHGMVLNGPDDPPVMDVTGLGELDSFDDIEDLDPGFIWYDENPKRWWQFWKR